MAAVGPLDVAPMGDLAEARWRTGDLEGAADAAFAHLEAGGDALVALVIAAEGLAADGRPGEAAAFVERAVEGAGGDPDAVFLGIPRRAAWPGAGGPEESRTTTDRQRGPTDPTAELDAARAALIEGRPAEAAVRLALVLRTDPELAPAVLAAVGSRGGAALDLVRGDAYRVVGRESDAAAAYDAAAAALHRGTALGERSGRRR